MTKYFVYTSTYGFENVMFQSVEAALAEIQRLRQFAAYRFVEIEVLHCTTEELLDQLETV